MCFLMRKRTDEMRGDQQLARQYYLTIIKEKKLTEALPIDDRLDQKEKESRGESTE